MSLEDIKEWHAVKHSHQGDATWARMQVLARQRAWHNLHATDRLSRAASAIWKLAAAHAEGAPMDALFDGGEWSAAAHQRDEAAEQEEIAYRFGYNGAAHLWDTLEARTSARWMHYCFPPLLIDDPYERDSIHGRSRNK